MSMHEQALTPDNINIITVAWAMSICLFGPTLIAHMRVHGRRAARLRAGAHRMVEQHIEQDP